MCLMTEMAKISRQPQSLAMFVVFSDGRVTLLTPPTLTQNR
jgi:hypothetical protein